MKTGIRVTMVANFENSPNPARYLAAGIALSIALKGRGFQLSDLVSTPNGVATSYDFNAVEEVRMSKQEVVAKSQAALVGNQANRDNGNAARAPTGLFVTVTFFTAPLAEADAMTPFGNKGELLVLGHAEILADLRNNGFVPMNAQGTDPDKSVITMGLNYETPFEYTQEVHDRIMREVLEGTDPEERAALEAPRTKLEAGGSADHLVKANPSMPGALKHPQMIFQNAKVGYILGSNTFRLGEKWFHALTPGDIVEAIDGTGARLGWLVVKGVERDNLLCAVNRSALENHGVKEMEIESKEEAIEYLLHILQGVYPNEEIRQETIASIITFEPEFARVEPKAFA